MRRKIFTPTATTYILGAGSTLSVASSPTGTFTQIAQCQKITYNGVKAEYQEITNFGSAPYATGSQAVAKEFTPSSITPGTANVTDVLASTPDPGQASITGAFAMQPLM